MSARRQASTTSLSKFARDSPVPHDRSTDFCNAFWGLGDGGVDVLFARMRGAARTMDELRNFWKERATIEDEYARRLAKLAKQTLGRDEIGELRSSFDTIRAETERQAATHLTLAQQVRSDLEGQTSAFSAKQQHFKKTYQSGIEKEFKAKQMQESYVIKARDKYENDCMRINSYTAQLGLVQGKDAERIHLKLERAQQTVVQNERDFANFARALGETTARWEQDWRVFCDSCHDLEDERLEFMKDNMWAYANAVSTVCVSDDESCENMRLALEQMEPEKDQENFVCSYGTGNQMPDPPAFVNYSDPNTIPSSSSRPSFRVSNFPRSSQRPPPMRRQSAQPEVQPEDDEPASNTAGVGAGGGVRRGDDPVAATANAGVSRQNTQSRSMNAVSTPEQAQPQHSISSFSPAPAANGAPGPDLSRQPTAASPRPSSHGFSPAPAANGSSGPDVSRRPTAASSRPSSYRVPPRDLHAEPIDPNAETFIKVGEHAYKVNLSEDPTQPGASSSRLALSSSPQSGFDPLAKQMEDLQTASASVRSRSTRGTQSRRGTIDTSPAPQNVNGNPNPNTRPSSSMSVGPSGATSNGATTLAGHQRGQSPALNRDYRYSADMVVGTHPTASRSASPNPAPITAAFMRPASSSSPPGADIVADVLTDYGQSLPGEGKSLSRQNSRRGSYSGPSPGSGAAPNHIHNASQSSQYAHGQNLARPPSQGYAGVGTPAGSRSSSPQPMAMARGQSPAMARRPSPAPAAANVHQSFITPPPPPSTINRSPSPNNVGIALDSSGRVMHDDMAQRYQQQHQQSVAQQVAPYNPHAAQAQQRLSYMGPGAVVPPPPPAPLQAGYGAVTPYQPQQHPHPSYVSVPPPQPTYTPAPYQAPAPQQVYQPQPHAHASAYGAVNGGLQHRMSSGSGYFPNGQQQPPPQQQQLVRIPQQQLQLQHSQSARRSPSPQAQKTSDGKWILFYVKALFPYNATIDEEFDFQEGDIIAVTATPEDGWWSGELLDDARRVPGKHIFPSNFVELFP